MMIMMTTTFDDDDDGDDYKDCGNWIPNTKFLFVVEKWGKCENSHKRQFSKNIGLFNIIEFFLELFESAWKSLKLFELFDAEKLKEMEEHLETDERNKSLIRKMF